MVQPLEKPDLPARYASLADFREGARRRIPNFAFEYLDGGIGRDVGLQRNYSELDKVMITPRNVDSTQAPQTGVEIFGESYSTPFLCGACRLHRFVPPAVRAGVCQAIERIRYAILPLFRIIFVN